jgi:hypothetical protein
MARVPRVLILRRTDADSEHEMSNVDERLLARFEASWERERARRDTLPPAWLQSELRPADHLGDLFDDVLHRARARVLAQRAELELLPRDDGFDPAV